MVGYKRGQSPVSINITFLVLAIVAAVVGFMLLFGGKDILINLSRLVWDWIRFGWGG